MARYCNRYLGIEDFRFPALKCRVEPFKKFRYARRGEVIEVEGIFIYKSAYPQRNPSVYKGYLDLREEYRLLGLRTPEKNQLRILCYLPADLTSRDRLLSKPNVRIRGKVWIDKGMELQRGESFAVIDPMLKNKKIVAEEIEFLPVEYTAVGAPAFGNLDDMFSCIYSRVPELYEHGAFLLLASLIGSEHISRYFPEENVGCGINMGLSPKEASGEVDSGRILPAMRKKLGDFIRKVNVGSLNKVSSQFKWNRFLSVKDPVILSRKMKTDNEIDWNLISDICNVNHLKNSEFITSDINLVFDPNLFPGRITREDMNNLKQTLIFAKSVPMSNYSGKVNAWIENKTEAVVKDLAKRVDYAPFLFRYRFEPLCDAFLRGNHLEDYLIEGKIKIKKNDVHNFFKMAEDAACDFADYAAEFIEEDRFSDILDSTKDMRTQDLYRELLVKGGMAEEDMIQYIIEKHAVVDRKAESLVSSLLHAEPVLVIKQGGIYKPV